MAFNTQALSRYHAEQHYTTSRTDLATPTLMHNHQLREQSLCRFVVNRHWPTKQQGMTVHFDCSLLIKGWLDHMRQIYSIAFFGGFWSGLIMLESINLSEISRSRPTVSASTPTLLYTFWQLHRRDTTGPVLISSNHQPVFPPMCV